jgi:hypothetical protein
VSDDGNHDDFDDDDEDDNEKDEKRLFNNDEDDDNDADEGEDYHHANTLLPHVQQAQYRLGLGVVSPKKIEFLCCTSAQL